MTLRQEQSNFTRALGKLLVYINLMGYEATLGDTYPGKWKHCNNSYHNRGLAIDINLFRDGQYLQKSEDHATIGAYWVSLGGTWGGNFKAKDGNHYSWNEGR